MELTPVAVDHAAPTVGYVIDDGKATVVITSDTGPTDAIWKQARKAKNCKAVFLEATFPDSMSWLADLAKHLTPASFAAEARKMPPGVRLIAVHLHPRYHGQVAKELEALKLTNLEIVKPGKRYRF
jgi:ribonuclease BN (tRNA processing enzyme)